MWALHCYYLLPLPLFPSQSQVPVPSLHGGMAGIVEFPLLQKTVMSQFLHTAALGLWSVAGAPGEQESGLTPLGLEQAQHLLLQHLAFSFPIHSNVLVSFSLPACQTHSIQNTAYDFSPRVFLSTSGQSL